MVVQIGVAAYSGPPPPKALGKVVEFIEEFTNVCRDLQIAIIFIVGGYEGLMKVFTDKILEKGFRVIILPPIEQEDQMFPSKAIVIRTGATFTIRSSILVHSSDILLALGGGVGTLEEIITAHNEGKPTYILIDTDLPTDIMKIFPAKISARALKPLKLYSDPYSLAKDLCYETMLKYHSKTLEGGLK